jgi:hypothetical protein
MSYIREVTTTRKDGPENDAFGRLRTSSDGNRLDCEFIYTKQPDYFDELTSNGTVTHNANSRDVTLSLSNAISGSYAMLRSFPVPYTPGNSQQEDSTGVLDLANLGGGTAELFLRSTISGTTTDLYTIPQSQWLNGNHTGINWNFSHILMIDFQSLKVGRARWNFVRIGLPSLLAEKYNDNIRNTGYWQNPSLPVYWKLYNANGFTYMEMGYGNNENAIGIRYKVTANASATMRAICTTVKSEGGARLREMDGLPRGIDMGGATGAKTVSTTLIPLISIKPKTTFQTFDNLILSIPKDISVQTDNPIRVVVLMNATLTGHSFVDVDTADSCMEYDITASAVTGGTIIHTEYFATSRNVSASGGSLLGKTVLWNRTGAKNGILTIAAVRTSTTNANVLAGINWEELR